MTDDAEDTLSRALAMLSHATRRQILRYIDKRNTTEDGICIQNLDQSVVELKHIHLPKLSNHGYIEWEEKAGKIAEGSNFDEIAPILRQLDELENIITDDSKDNESQAG